MKSMIVLLAAFVSFSAHAETVTCLFGNLALTIEVNEGARTVKSIGQEGTFRYKHAIIGHFEDETRVQYGGGNDEEASVLLYRHDGLGKDGSSQSSLTYPYSAKATFAGEPEEQIGGCESTREKAH